MASPAGRSTSATARTWSRVPSATVRSRAVGGKGTDTGGASDARDTLPAVDPEDPEAVTMSGADLALSTGAPSMKT